MLGKEIVEPDKLLQKFRSSVNEYCDKTGVRRIPVTYGKVENDRSGGEFNVYRPKITLNPKLPHRLIKYSHHERSWKILELLGHELKHYDQYLELKKSGISPRPELFDEKKAKSAGLKHANESIGKYASEQINPILPEIASGMVAGIGLGAGFKTSEVIWNKLFKKKNPTEPHPIYAPSTKKFSGMIFKLYEVIPDRRRAKIRQLGLKREGWSTRLFEVYNGWAIYRR